MKRILKIIFCILIGIILLPAILYFIPFHGNRLSNDKETWNTFSYVWGASLGTGISAITLFILLLDRKSDSNEKKTNQAIDFLFRQNDMITKNYSSGEGYTVTPIDSLFHSYNEQIKTIYTNRVIFNFLINNNLSKCDNQIQEYICFGYSIAHPRREVISAIDFDSKLDDESKMECIRRAPEKCFEKKTMYGDLISTVKDSSGINNNFEVIEKLSLSYDPETMKNILMINEDYATNFPYKFYSFRNTYRSALNQLMDYTEGLVLYFSQLSLEQKIFIAYDISSFDNKKLFNKINKTKILKEELLSDEVRNNGFLINYIYKN